MSARPFTPDTLAELNVPIRFFTIDEVAAMFRVSRRTMQDHIKAYPHYRLIGRRKLFTETNIAELMETLGCPSNSSGEKAPSTGTFGAPSEASLFSRARALTTRSSRKKSASAGKTRR